MKTTIEFELPMEQSQYQDAINGSKWHLAAFQMEQFLRARIKYAPDSMPDEVRQQLIAVQTKFYQIIEQHNLTIEP
jgi:hypothetical protein